jgi:hypothetical protein
VFLYQTFHVCFAARFVVTLRAVYIFMEMITCKLTVFYSGCIKQEKLSRYVIQLLYDDLSGTAVVTTQKETLNW